jgi:hypothetical protein
MHPELHALDNLAHARWKVSFIGHLLQAHLGSSHKHTVEWQERHAAMLQHLAAAEDEVKLCEQALKAVQSIVEGPHETPSESQAEAPFTHDRE